MRLISVRPPVRTLAIRAEGSPSYRRQAPLQVLQLFAVLARQSWVWRPEFVVARESLTVVCLECGGRSGSSVEGW
jgi:hypothetical protein